MITYKKWLHIEKSKHLGFIKDQYIREGWFLFGIIPLYVRDVTVRGNYHG